MQIAFAAVGEHYSETITQTHINKNEIVVFVSKRYPMHSYTERRKGAKKTYKHFFRQTVRDPAVQVQWIIQISQIRPKYLREQGTWVTVNICSISAVDHEKH